MKGFNNFSGRFCLKRTHVHGLDISALVKFIDITNIEFKIQK